MNRNKLAPLLLVLCVCICRASQTPGAAEVARWQREAASVSIVRDDWGIAHIHGLTDAGAVFGMVYAQAEDDFCRVETNYINALGRLAETEGESKMYQDLRMKLFIDPATLKSDYDQSPAWLQRLMIAFADGLNFYLAKHPAVHPRVIRHFEPWMALSFTEGSIGGDIEHISIDRLRAFYGNEQTTSAATNQELPATGSNGIAIAPSNTASHRALLLINPHTTFYFRSELQVTSDEGLNAYGAVTWGQFFVYQGFNSKAGWMHTSSGVDAVDEYLETVQKKNGVLVYKYGQTERPVTVRTIVVPYKTATGMAKRSFTIYATHHGPVIRDDNGKWVAIRLMQKPIDALTQSFLRTKATDYKSYGKTMELRANSSNNTVFADAQGDIAYFHGNFIPRRDPRFDWTKPVDGSDPATEWHGLLTVDETPHLLNPRSGWLYNSNNWPWSGAGESSLRKQDYPPYVETGAESARGLHAVSLLTGKKDFTLASLISSAYDSYLTWFDKPLPALIRAWDRIPVADPLKTRLASQIDLLRKWDRRWNVDSIATSLAVFWGTELWQRVSGGARYAGLPVEDYAATKVPAIQLLECLDTASNNLQSAFGTWQTPWGQINRLQRLNDDLAPNFRDDQPSIPVGFTWSRWGSLASFEARPYPGTKKWYGTTGNSFVAVVEFGDRVRARAVTVGGESGHPGNRHFNDQSLRYGTGRLRDVYFYPEDLARHTERKYHPGTEVSSSE